MIICTLIIISLTTRRQEPLAMGSGVTVEKVYGLSRWQQDLGKEEKKYILGVQANYWTEYIAT